ncbi:toxin glutamine deamidase domain-containing protein [Actinoplanes sp. NPDC000266]
MGIDVSDEYNRFQFWLSGEQFPAVDETILRQLGEALRSLGLEIEGLQPDFVAVVNSLSSAMQGAADRAFVDAMREYVDNPGFLPLAGRYVYRMSDDFDNLAVEVEYAKLMIIATLVELLITFMIVLALQWLFPGLISGWLLRLVIGRSRVIAFLLRLGMQIAMGQAMGAGAQVIMSLAVQAIMKRNGSIDDIDWKKVSDSAAIGALGGALGVGVGQLYNILGPQFGKVFAKIIGRDGPGRPDPKPEIPPAPAVPRSTVGDEVPPVAPRSPVTDAPPVNRAPAPPEQEEGWVDNVVVEAGTEVLVGPTWAGIQGEEVTAESLYGGAASGAVSGLTEHAGHVSGDALRHRTHTGNHAGPSSPVPAPDRVGAPAAEAVTEGHNEAPYDDLALPRSPGSSATPAPAGPGYDGGSAPAVADHDATPAAADPGFDATPAAVGPGFDATPAPVDAVAGGVVDQREVPTAADDRTAAIPGGGAETRGDPGVPSRPASPVPPAASPVPPAASPVPPAASPVPPAASPVPPAASPATGSAAPAQQSRSPAPLLDGAGSDPKPVSQTVRLSDEFRSLNDGAGRTVEASVPPDVPAPGSASDPAQAFGPGDTALAPDGTTRPTEAGPMSTGPSGMSSADGVSHWDDHVPAVAGPMSAPDSTGPAAVPQNPNAAQPPQRNVLDHDRPPGAAVPSGLAPASIDFQWWAPQGAGDAVFHQRYGWLAQVNDGGQDRHQTGERTVNCFLAALATHMAVETQLNGEIPSFVAPGLAIEDPQYSGGGVDAVEVVAYANDTLPAPGGTTGPRRLVRAESYDVIARALRAAGRGAQGLVIVGGPGGRNHLVNVVNDGDGVLFLDGQRGGRAVLPAHRPPIFIPVGPVEVAPLGDPVEPGEVGRVGGEFDPALTREPPVPPRTPVVGEAPAERSSPDDPQPPAERESMPINAIPAESLPASVHRVVDMAVRGFALSESTGVPRTHGVLQKRFALGIQIKGARAGTPGAKPGLEWLFDGGRPAGPGWQTVSSWEEIEEVAENTGAGSLTFLASGNDDVVFVHHGHDDDLRVVTVNRDGSQVFSFDDYRTAHEQPSKLLPVDQCADVHVRRRG